MTGGAARTGGQTDQTEEAADTAPIAGVAVGATVLIAPVVGMETDRAAGAGAIPPTEGNDQASLPPDPRSQPPAPDHVYDELIGSGLSRADGAAALHTMGYGMDTNRWRDRRQALGVGHGKPHPLNTDCTRRADRGATRR
jgi:hypothetical protein